MIRSPVYFQKLPWSRKNTVVKYVEVIKLHILMLTESSFNLFDVVSRKAFFEPEETAKAWVMLLYHNFKKK